MLYFRAAWKRDSISFGESWLIRTDFIMRSSLSYLFPLDFSIFKA